MTSRLIFFFRRSTWKESIYRMTSLFTVVDDFIEQISRRGRFLYFNLVKYAYFSTVFFKLYYGHDFIYWFHLVAFLNDVVRECGFVFCVDKICSMFFKSCVEISVCPLYIKCVAVCACQFINSLSAIFVKYSILFGITLLIFLFFFL